MSPRQIVAARNVRLVNIEGSPGAGLPSYRRRPGRPSVIRRTSERALPGSGSGLIEVKHVAARTGAARVRPAGGPPTHRRFAGSQTGGRGLPRARAGGALLADLLRGGAGSGLRGNALRPVGRSAVSRTAAEA